MAASMLLFWWLEGNWGRDGRHDPHGSHSHTHSLTGQASNVLGEFKYRELTVWMSGSVIRTNWPLKVHHCALRCRNTDRINNN